MSRILSYISLIALVSACEGTPVSLGEFIVPDAGQMILDAEPVLDSGPIDSGPTGPSLVLSPSELSFGPTLVTCAQTQQLVIENPSDTFNTITRVIIDGPSNFELSEENFPLTVIPNEQVELDIIFTPSSTNSTISAIIRVEYSTPQTTDVIDVIVNGYGVETRNETDNFTQKSSPEIDFLFVIDRSCSMSEEFSYLATQLNKLDTYLQNNLVDFHIGITDMDTQNTNGQLLGEPKVITQQTPNYTQVLRSQLRPQSGGGFIEAGIESSILALSEPLISTENAGFLREKSALSVFYISDEADQSPQMLSNYEEQLRALRPSGMLDLRAIVHLASGASVPCGAQLGRGYIELVNLFGGYLAELCERDWEPILSDFPSNFGLNTQFDLSYPAESESLSVTVDGVKTSSVSLLSDQTHIEFMTSSIPNRNAMIQVQYQTRICRE